MFDMASWKQEWRDPAASSHQANVKLDRYISEHDSVDA
jgi:hypothetical protein